MKLIKEKIDPCTVIIPCFAFGALNSLPETHTKRQATQRGCLPSLLGDEDKGIEIEYGEEKTFCTGPTRAAKAEQKSLVPHDKPNEPTKKGPLPFVHFEPHSPQQSAGATPIYSLSGGYFI